MRAVVYEDIHKVRVDDVADPRILDPHDAIIRVTTAAICGSDLHFYNGKAPMSPGDGIGHEGVGVVEAVGPEVERFRTGDRVVMAFDIACGHCWFCLHGQTSLCEDFRNLGAGPFGGRRVPVPPDPATLRAIADRTGGEFFAAQSAKSLQSAYKKLGSRLGRKPGRSEITYGFLAAAALLLVAAGLLSALWSPRLP
jgi:hypothetical protein